MDNTDEAQQTILTLTAQIGPATAYLAQRSIELATQAACMHCLWLLDIPSFPPTRVERAALRLVDYNVYDFAALKFLLMNDVDILLPDSEADLDGQLLLPFTKGFSANVQSRSLCETKSIYRET